MHSARSSSRSAAAAWPVGLSLVVGLCPAALALPQAAGPISIEAAQGHGDPQHRQATLTATITNQGVLPDRLLRATCPGFGGVTFASAQPAAQPGEAPGLDLPGAIGGHVTPVEARLDLTGTTQPMTSGGLVPCALYFRHGGERLVIFSLDARDPLAAEP